MTILQTNTRQVMNNFYPKPKLHEQIWIYIYENHNNKELATDTCHY